MTGRDGKPGAGSTPGLQDAPAGTAPSRGPDSSPHDTLKVGSRKPDPGDGQRNQGQREGRCDLGTAEGGRKNQQAA